MPLKAYWAFSFSCEQSLDATVAAFNEAGPWRWQMRESSYYGDYLNVRPEPGVRVRIHETGGDRTVTCQIELESAATQSEIDDVVRSLLHRLGVNTVRAAEPYD